MEKEQKSVSETISSHAKEIEDALRLLDTERARSDQDQTSLLSNVTMFSFTRGPLLIIVLSTC